MQPNPLRVTVENQKVAHCAEYVLGLKPLMAYYDQWVEQVAGQDIDDDQLAGRFLDFVLGALATDIEVRHADRLNAIPTDKPLIFFSNHPLGGLEGMLLSRLLLKYRPDLKVLVNEFLLRIPEFKRLFVGVNILSETGSSNRRQLKRICRHLSDNGALLVFPAGTVATWRWFEKGVVEKPWKLTMARLARRYECHCLPMFVEGRNSTLFQVVGLMYPFLRSLRTAMLPREMLKMRGKCIPVTVGHVVHPETIAGCQNERQLTEYLKTACEDLNRVDSEL